MNAACVAAVSVTVLLQLSYFQATGTTSGPRGLGFRAGVSGLGFRVWGLGFRVWGLGFGFWGLGFGVQGFGFRPYWVLQWPKMSSFFRTSGPKISNASGPRTPLYQRWA